MTETIPGGPEAFLEYLREELRPCAPSHHVSFAAALAERGLAVVGEYADWNPRLGQGASPLQIVNALWGHACERRITPDQIGEFESDLSALAALVDPDRLAAFRSYSGIALLTLAIRCCVPGGGIASVVEVARASLHISTGFGLSDDYQSNLELRERWNATDVQAEAQLQIELARTLRSASRVERDTVKALRRKFVT
jgi:uncharacterized protein YjaG (DUF416 family)